MEHFVRITMEKQEESKSLDESIFSEQEIYETQQGGTVYQIPLARELSEQEAQSVQGAHDQPVWQLRRVDDHAEGRDVPEQEVHQALRGHLPREQRPAQAHQLREEVHG